MALFAELAVLAVLGAFAVAAVLAVLTVFVGISDTGGSDRMDAILLI